MKPLVLATAMLCTSSFGFSQTAPVELSTAERYRYFVIVNNSDDRMVIKVNNGVARIIETSHDRGLNERIEITSLLQKSSLTGYVNTIIIEGWNGPTEWQGAGLNTWLQENPWHFKFYIEKVDTKTGKTEFVIAPQNFYGPTPRKEHKHPYLAGSWKYDIIKE